MTHQVRASIAERPERDDHPGNTVALGASFAVVLTLGSIIVTKYSSVRLDY